MPRDFALLSLLCGLGFGFVISGIVFEQSPFLTEKMLNPDQPGIQSLCNLAN